MSNPNPKLNNVENPIEILDGTNEVLHPLDGYSTQTSLSRAGFSKETSTAQNLDINSAFDEILSGYVPTKQIEKKVSAKEQTQIDLKKKQEQRAAIALKEREAATKKAQETASKNQPRATSGSKKTQEARCEECDQPMKKCQCYDDNYDSYYK